MKLCIQSSLFFLFCCPLPSFAEYQIVGEGLGRITKIEIEAGVKVDASYFNQDGKDFYFTAYWEISLDKASQDKAKINATFDLGDHYVLAKSNRMIGVTRQEFYEFQYLIEGIGNWNDQEKVFSYVVEPIGADKGNASEVVFSRRPACKKISGLLASRACKAFLASSLELEGVRLRIKFKEDLSNFEGHGILTQHGGDGITESLTKMTISFSGKTSPK